MEAVDWRLATTDERERTMGLPAWEEKHRGQRMEWTRAA